MLKIYSVRDKVAQSIVCTFHCANDGLAVRENAPALSKVAPLGDLEMVHIGNLDESTFEIEKVPIKIVDWNSYKFPESPILPIKTEKKTEKKGEIEND